MAKSPQAAARASLAENLEYAMGERTGTAERVASVLRTRIIEGKVEPGARITEDVASRALGVSRNTLREAFQLLSHERLLTHELSRGVFVRQLSIDDLRDLYAVRLHIECSAIRSATEPTEDELAVIRRTLAEATQAAAAAAWRVVGTASIQFHLHVCDLARSARISEFMRQVMAEFRLIFPLFGDNPEPYKHYLDQHGTILKFIERGDQAAAETEMRNYLEESRSYLCDLYAARLESDR